MKSSSRATLAPRAAAASMACMFSLLGLVGSHRASHRMRTPSGSFAIAAAVTACSARMPQVRLARAEINRRIASCRIRHRPKWLDHFRGDDTVFTESFKRMKTNTITFPITTSAWLLRRRMILLTTQRLQMSSIDGHTTIQFRILLVVSGIFFNNRLSINPKGKLRSPIFLHQGLLEVLRIQISAWAS